MHIEVPKVPREVLLSNESEAETSTQIRERVCQARARQIQRSGKPNSQLNNRETERHCRLQPHDSHLLSAAIERLGLSARSAHRVLRVARTIADLEVSEALRTPHLTEAISYRRLERH